MKILLLTPFLPYPPRATSKVRPFNWLKHLSAKHQISLVSFIDSAAEKGYADQLRGYCRQVVTVLRKEKGGILPRSLNLFQKAPYFVVKQFQSAAMQEQAKRILSENEFDVIHAVSLAMTQYAAGAEGASRVVEAVDCLTRNYLQQYRLPLGIRDRVLAYIDWTKMKRYEPAAFSCFDECILANPTDKEFIRPLLPDTPVDVIPYGVDLDYFKPQGVDEEFPSLVFTGSMNYIPNADAVGYFCSEILPRIEKEYPGIKVYVLGRDDRGRIKRYIAGRKNVIYPGFVGDVRPFLSKASIFICPLRMGTGIKNKVLEAMAMAKPLVSSSVGLEGIDLKDRESVLVADDPATFSRAVSELIADRGLRGRLGAEARQVAERDHSWRMLAGRVDEVYSRIAGKRR